MSDFKAAIFNKHGCKFINYKVYSRNSWIFNFKTKQTGSECDSGRAVIRRHMFRVTTLSGCGTSKFDQASWVCLPQKDLKFSTISEGKEDFPLSTPGGEKSRFLLKALIFLQFLPCN